MIPGPSDPCWRRAICSEKDLSAASLATKILVSRLRQETKSNPAKANEKIAELRKYFDKYTFASKDIALF